MDALSLLISLILAGQVASGDRYSGGATASNSATGGALEALEEPAASAGASDVGDPDGVVPLVQPFSPGSESPASSAATAPPPFSNTQSPFGASRNGAPRSFPPPASQSPTSRQPLNSYPSQGTTNPQGPPPSSATATLKPSAMMRAMLTPPPVSRLAGHPVALAQAVSGAPTREQQSECIEAYWDLCSSVADYHLSLHEQRELTRLRSLLSNTSPSATWQQAEAELGVRVSTSQVAVMASQYRLASLMHLDGGAGGLPLPADVPHCGDYQTHYQHLFTNRPNAEAQELVALLPLRYEELKDGATAVTRAEEWLTAQRGAADETALLRALELLAMRRRAFVQIARDYNRRISRYSELAAPGDIGSDRLISMLIKSTASSSATRTSPTAPPPSRQSSGTTTRQTYAEGWTAASSSRNADGNRDEAVEPASAEAQTLHKERSLLVPSR